MVLVLAMLVGVEQIVAVKHVRITVMDVVPVIVMELVHVMLDTLDLIVLVQVKIAMEMVLIIVMVLAHVMLGSGVLIVLAQNVLDHLNVVVKEIADAVSQ
jgi:hypothetical protein